MPIPSRCLQSASHVVIFTKGKEQRMDLTTSGNAAFILRRATLDDVPAVRELFRTTVLTVNAADYTADEVADWAACGDDDARWIELIATLHFVVAAYGSGKVVGYASLRGDGYLHSLFTHCEWQRRGVATALLREVERHAEQSGLSLIRTEASITARPFFVRRGYVVEAEQQARARRLWMTNFRMWKRLGQTY